MADEEEEKTPDEEMEQLRADLLEQGREEGRREERERMRVSLARNPEAAAAARESAERRLTEAAVGGRARADAAAAQGMTWEQFNELPLDEQEKVTPSERARIYEAHDRGPITRADVARVRHRT